MTRIFWDAILLISSSLATFGVGQSHPTIINASLSVDTNPTTAPDTFTIHNATATATATPLPAVQNSFFTPGAGQSDTTIIDASISSDTNSTVTPTTSTSGGSSNATTTAMATNVPAAQNSLFTVGTGQSNTVITNSSVPNDANSAAAPNTSTSGSAAPGSRSSSRTTIVTSTSETLPVKKFEAAAVRSHFDDCPDSHRHFCFHGTCRFLILEESPACVCHQGYMGMRCEHADLLAVVATNHRQQTVATVLVLCVIGCVLIMVLCTLLHCWWRQDCRRRSHVHHYVPEKSSKHGASCCPSESVV